MPQGKSPDSHKAQQWRQLLELCRRSGLSVRAFCRRHRLAENGDLYLRNVGDESESGTVQMILNDLEKIPKAELVPAAAGVVVIREWFERKRLSDAIKWRAH